MDSIQQINTMDRDAFVERFGPVYERSPWVAERVSAQRPLRSVDDLYAAMQKCVLAASHEEQLALIRIHPELLGKLAPVDQLSAESRSEQASVGLDECSQQELAQLRMLTRAYREKFGFPFVVAVRGMTRWDIIERMKLRLANQPKQEFRTCLDEIGRIARFRLDDLLGE
jgi:2-oxo-4-hydroxy-4-carboxy-5-ureidoimidazoline decarboxylase